MGELINKLDIQGKLDSLGLIATFWNTSAEIYGYLENDCGWGTITSLIVSYLISFFVVIWKEYKYVILVIIVLTILLGIARYLNEKYEEQGYKKKHRTGTALDPRAEKKKEKKS